jgi:hypothetical protein
MSFLKKFGQIVGRVGLEFAGLSPLADRFYPKAAGVIAKARETIDELADVIVTVEAIGTSLELKGEQKLQAAIPLVGQAILKSALLVDKKVRDEALFNKATVGFAQAMVDLLNSLEAKVETEDKKA